MPLENASKKALPAYGGVKRRLELALALLAALIFVLSLILDPVVR